MPVFHVDIDNISRKFICSDSLLARCDAYQRCSVGPLVCPSSVPWSYRENEARKVHSYYGHYTEVGTADSVAAFRSKWWFEFELPNSPDAPVGEILVSASDHKCCQRRETVVSPPLLLTEYDRRNLLLTLIVHCIDNTDGMTRKSKWGRPASYRSEDILVCFCMLGCPMTSRNSTEIGRVSKQMIIYPRSTFTHDFPYFRWKARVMTIIQWR